MTPQPTTPENSASLLGFQVIIILILALVAGFVIVFIIMRLAHVQPHSMIPALVAVVTLSSLIAFTFTKEEGLETISATGLGALCGALTYLYQREDPGKEKPNERQHPDNDEEDPRNR